MATSKKLPPPPRVMTLSLVVKYDEASVDEAVEAAKDLIEKAREYGEVTMARLDNLPDSVDLT